MFIIKGSTKYKGWVMGVNEHLALCSGNCYESGGNLGCVFKVVITYLKLKRALPGAQGIPFISARNLWSMIKMA